MARMLSFFVKERQQEDVKVLVATSGDTGSAVANGFLGVDGIQVFVLYPSGKVRKCRRHSLLRWDKILLLLRLMALLMIVRH